MSGPETKMEFGNKGGLVRLGPLGQDSLNLIFEWKNDMMLANAIMAHPLPVAKADVEEWLQRNQSDKNQILFGIYSNEENSLIGISRLMFIDWISSCAEFGIYIGDENFRGKGLGKEAAALTLDFAFRELNLNRVSLRVQAKNERALKLYEKLSFKKEGVLRQAFCSEGKYSDVVVMGLLRDEHIG